MPGNAMATETACMFGGTANHAGFQKVGKRPKSFFPTFHFLQQMSDAGCRMSVKN